MGWLCVSLAGLAFAVSGCASGPRAGGGGMDPAAMTQAERDAAAAAIARQSAAYHERHGGSVAPEVTWMDAEIPRDTAASLRVEDMRPEPARAELPAERSSWGEAGPGHTMAKPEWRVDAPAGGGQDDGRALLDELIRQVASAETGPRGRALRAAALMALESDAALPESVLKGLTDDERVRVERFHSVVREMNRALASGEALDAEALVRRLASGLEVRSAGDSIRIHDIQLCTSVSRFGVFEPFEQAVFLAGQRNRMIVYLELDGYRSTQMGADHAHVVRLTQEIELYDDAGLLVWRQTPEAIEDRSRKPRRDFFTVQLIELPARLTVGRFFLKARVIDEANGHRAERSVPIEIVADWGLAMPDRAPVPLGG
ncbi:MAG: hypothetical protein AAF823_15610 [Planctomycetota bacterium]